MKYGVVFEEKALKALKKIDKYQAQIITNWIEKNLSNCENPRLHGKALKGELNGYWRYRIGTYRLLSKINDYQVKIIIINVAHRRSIYDANN